MHSTRQYARVVKPGEQHHAQVDASKVYAVEAEYTAQVRVDSTSEHLSLQLSLTLAELRDCTKVIIVSKQKHKHVYIPPSTTLGAGPSPRCAIVD